MRQADWTFLLHWAPTLGAIVILSLAGLILQAAERRSAHGRGTKSVEK